MLFFRLDVADKWRLQFWFSYDLLFANAVLYASETDDRTDCWRHQREHTDTRSGHRRSDHGGGVERLTDLCGRYLGIALLPTAYRRK